MTFELFGKAKWHGVALGVATRLRRRLSSAIFDFDAVSRAACREDLLAAQFFTALCIIWALFRDPARFYQNLKESLMQLV